jgi:hypothetical protein
MQYETENSLSGVTPGFFFSENVGEIFDEHGENIMAMESGTKAGEP